LGSDFKTVDNFGKKGDKKEGDFHGGTKVDRRQKGEDREDAIVTCSGVIIEVNTRGAGKAVGFVLEFFK